MSMARLNSVNGFLEDARMEPGDMGRILRCLEMGTVLTLFYQKKSQRPERRTFQVKLETRQIIWSRTPEKVEGDSEYRGDREDWGDRGVSVAVVLGGWGCAGGMLSSIGVTAWGCSGCVGVSCHSGVSGCGVLGCAVVVGGLIVGCQDMLECLGFVGCPTVVG